MKIFFKSIFIFFSPILSLCFAVSIALIMVSKYVIKNSNQYYIPQNKELIYELIDNHSSRPGHDLRYSLSSDLLKSLGWEPKIKLSKRIEEVVDWSLKNNRWLS